VSKQKRYIVFPIDEKKELAEEFNVSLQAVYNALNYKTKSKKAKAIRAVAMNRGGMEYPPQSLNTSDEEQRRTKKS
jgi:DeoR/GlpR family transcriptional regulator of sugar metabolism